MNFIDLNCDLGEGFGAYSCGADEDLLSIVSSANIACGFHASDPLIMSRVVAAASWSSVAIGAHPGYPDLVGFGRRAIDASPEEVKAMVQYQIGALLAFCQVNGVRLQHVKPHGALYNTAAKTAPIAAAICEAIGEIDSSLILLAPAGSCMETAAAEVGIPFAKEFFADRAYEDDGSLVSRSKAGAMITDADEAIDRVLHMVHTGSICSINGIELPMEPDSICLHGDSPTAVAFARKLRDALEADGICIAPMGEMF